MFSILNRRTNLIGLPIVCLGALTISLSNAEEVDKGFYISLSGGITDTNQWKSIETFQPVPEYKEVYNTIVNNESAWSAGVGFGYDFGNFRTELTYNRSATKFDSVKRKLKEYAGPELELVNSATSPTFDLTEPETIHINSTILSLLYDVPTNNKFQPYLGLGVGISNVNNNGAQLTDEEGWILSNESSHLLSYQAKAGVSTNIDKNKVFFLEGAYKWVQGPSFNEPYEDGSPYQIAYEAYPLEQYSLEAGIRFLF